MSKAAEVFESKVLAKLDDLRAVAEARRRLKAADRASMPEPVTLGELLDEPDEGPTWRITDLWPGGGLIVFSSAFKAGKTITVDNLVRCLVDGGDFLGRFRVEPVTGTVILFDCELPRRKLRRWLRDQGIGKFDRLIVISLRGRVSSFDITDPAVRARWAAKLRPLGPSVLILDPMRPVIDAAGLDEDKDGGKLLTAFVELAEACGASETLVVHHHGHSGERSRGSSVLRDRPDAEWKIVRQGEEERAPRYFSAYGRDVDVPESELGYNSMTRRLTLLGRSRKVVAAEAAATRARDAVVDLLRGNGSPVSKGDLEEALRAAPHNLTRNAARDAIRAAVGAGLVDVDRQGDGVTVMHSLPEWS